MALFLLIPTVVALPAFAGVAALPLLYAGEILLVIVLVIIFRKMLMHDLKIFCHEFKGMLSTAFKCWILGVIAMIVTMTAISAIMPASEPSNQVIVDSFIETNLGFTIFFAVICAPLTEELTFRAGFKKAFGNIYVFCLFTALLFGIMHTGFDLEELIFIIPYGALGFALAYAYYKTGNIYASITIHAFHNLLSILLTLFLV